MLSLGSAKVAVAPTVYQSILCRLEAKFELFGKRLGFGTHGQIIEGLALGYSNLGSVFVKRKMKELATRLQLQRKKHRKQCKTINRQTCEYDKSALCKDASLSTALYNC